MSLCAVSCGLLEPSNDTDVSHLLKALKIQESNPSEFGPSNNFIRGDIDLKTRMLGNDYFKLPRKKRRVYSSPYYGKVFFGLDSWSQLDSGYLATRPVLSHYALSRLNGELVFHPICGCKHYSSLR